jgi:hypothetical protein
MLACIAVAPAKPEGTEIRAEMLVRIVAMLATTGGGIVGVEDGGGGVVAAICKSTGKLEVADMASCPAGAGACCGAEGALGCSASFS